MKTLWPSADADSPGSAHGTSTKETSPLRAFAAGLFSGVSAFVHGFNRAARGFTDGLAFSAPRFPRSAKPQGKQPGTAKSPYSIRLEFSKAADYGRITRFFDPEIKDRIDPKKYVVRREDGVLRRAIGNGSCAFLSDVSSPAAAAPQAMAIAYRMEKDGAHAYTEVGTTLSRMGGYNCAQLVIAALALNEWWSAPPQDLIVTEIMPDNIPSIKTYAWYLGWRLVTDRQKSDGLHDLANATIAPQDRSTDTVWFHCDDTVITHQARVLLSFMDQGGLVHKKTHRTLSVDFSALAACGLTRRRLEAIALGVTDRKALARMAP